MPDDAFEIAFGSEWYIKANLDDSEPAGLRTGWLLE
jgi:hypothetical protein